MKTILSVCLFSGLATLSGAQPQPIKDAMHAIYANLETAYNKGNIAAIDSVFSPDFKWHMLDGKTLSRSDAETNLKEELSSVQSGKWKVVIVNVVGIGQLATAVVQYGFNGVMLDSSKKPYGLNLTSTERQNWVRGANGWKMTSDTILNLSSKQNGIVASPNVKASDRPVQTPPPSQVGVGGG